MRSPHATWSRAEPCSRAGSAGAIDPGGGIGGGRRGPLRPELHRRRAARCARPTQSDLALNRVRAPALPAQSVLGEASEGAVEAPSDRNYIGDGLRDALDPRKVISR